MGHGDGCGDVQRSGIDEWEFYDDGIESDGGCGSFRPVKRSCEQYAVLLGSERDECRRYERMVERVEFYDDHRGSCRADACFAFG